MSDVSECIYNVWCICWIGERRRSSAEDTVGGQCELSGVCLTAVYGEQLKRQTVPLQYQHDGWIYIYQLFRA